MNTGWSAVGIVVLGIFGCGCGAKPASPTDTTALVRQLGELKVGGAGVGGPYSGVLHNDVTRSIVAQGHSVVPALVERLPVAGYDETVYVVFCLREMKAASAKTAVRQLQSDLRDGKRFQGERHDLTLKIEIEQYLKEVEAGDR